MPVINDGRKKRWKKGFNRRRKEASEFTQQADLQIENLLIRRFDRLVSLKKFIFLWLALFVVLIFSTVVQLRALVPYYQELRPVLGGIYSEGIIGSFSNANPIYATNTVDVAASRLVFSGLFKYDKDNNLVGDLATGLKANELQNRYTVSLRKDVEWHDGKPFTADDVIFTYHTIQEPEAQSPLYSSWQGIKISKKDLYTVNFDLPSSLSPFPYSLTNGILPQHSLKKFTAPQLRTAQFNSYPVGTGPFVWKFVEVTGINNAERQQSISLAAYDKYHEGRPKLDGFNLITYSSEDKLISAFKAKQLNAMSGLNSVSSESKKDKRINVYATPLTSAVMAFFNNSTPFLTDATVRRALVSGADHDQVFSLISPAVNLVNGPLLPQQLGYDPLVVQMPYDKAAAIDGLEKAGWASNGDAPRIKDGKLLELSLAAQDSPEYTAVAQFLQKQWSGLGVKVNVHYYAAEDLQASIIANHDYDVLLYGISLGADPDVFAYWDSSQANVGGSSGLNLSEYSSKTVDQALQAGRTRADPGLRIPKYKTFVSTWVKDAPALALYQPNTLYVSHGKVFNFERVSANSSADRFYNVNNWMVRQRHQNVN